MWVFYGVKMALSYSVAIGMFGSEFRLPQTYSSPKEPIKIFQQLEAAIFDDKQATKVRFLDFVNKHFSGKDQNPATAGEVDNVGDLNHALDEIVRLEHITSDHPMFLYVRENDKEIKIPYSYDEGEDKSVAAISLSVTGGFGIPLEDSLFDEYFEKTLRERYTFE